MSRATTIRPESRSGVATGWRLSWARISAMGRLRSTGTAAAVFGATAGRNRAGSVSSCSRKTPSRVILPFTLRSALQLTPSPIGHEAPCRGRRITRVSRQNHLPPNCAPSPIPRLAFIRAASSSRSRKACPEADPRVGRPSR